MRIITQLTCILHAAALYNCLPVPDTTIAATKPRSEVKKAAAYLAKFGYASNDFAVGDPTEEGMRGFLKNFQKYADIPVTGNLDTATMKKMEEGRCGMKDPRIQLKLKRRKRYVLYGTSWNEELKADRTLTWKVINSGKNFDMPTVRRIMFYAFQKWSNAANINFKESMSDDSDILVSFRSGFHNDQFPFDGMGGTLAHAFYPYPGQAIGGDIHFDNDENFTYGKSTGTDVLWVAVHEAGHSLGLEHSQKLDAVMYPWYRGTTGNDFGLTSDDVKGIEALYGPRQKTTIIPSTTKMTTPTPPVPDKTTITVLPPLSTTVATTPQPSTLESTEPTSVATTPKPTTPEITEPATLATTVVPTTPKSTEPTPVATTPKPTTPKITPGTEQFTQPVPTTAATKSTASVTEKSCPDKVNAAVIVRYGWLLVFIGDSFFLVSKRGKEYGPLKIRDYFKGLRGGVTAAYRRNDDSIVIFHGKRFNVYDHFQLIESNQPVTKFGLPADTEVDAALVWPGNEYANWRQGDKIYLFSGKLYYRYDSITQSIDSSYPKVISKLWRGLPNKVNAAFSGSKTVGLGWKTHFFGKSEFYRFNDRRVRTFDDYPRSIREFMNC